MFLAKIKIFFPVQLQVGQISIKNVLLQQAPLPANLCHNMGISTS